MDCFILGAGFSIAIDPLFMLTTDALVKRIVARQRSIHLAPPLQHSTICDGLSCDFPHLVDGHLPTPNFEVWLSRLAEPQPYLVPASNSRRSALFGELSGLIGLELEGAVEDVSKGNPPPWLLSLVRWWHDSRAEVITFNYDTLVEQTVNLLAIPHPGGSQQGDIDYHYVGPSSIPYFASMFGGTRLVPATTFEYRKLHGSTNWYWDPETRSAVSMVEIGLRSLWGQPGPLISDEDRAHRAPGKVSVVVPPTASKSSFFDNSVVQSLWRGAFEALRRADRAFILGYSLPATDLLVANMLTDALQVRRAPLWVVNPDPDVVTRVEALNVDLKPEHIGGGSAISDFVDAFAPMP